MLRYENLSVQKEAQILKDKENNTLPQLFFNEKNVLRRDMSHDLPTLIRPPFIRDIDKMPDIQDVEILINNAGTQNEEDIDINLKSLIRVTEKYGVQGNIKSILNIGSASGHTGSEFPEYCASKGGIIAYTKNVALRVAQYGATCNSLDPGGVITPLNECVINDPGLWKEIMDQTPLKRWASAEEIAAWAYFLTVENRFCTGQSIVVDGGESINSRFIWPE